MSQTEPLETPVSIAPMTEARPLLRGPRDYSARQHRASGGSGKGKAARHSGRDRFVDRTTLASDRRIDGAHVLAPRTEMIR
jgi:hypothetical protein